MAMVHDASLLDDDAAYKVTVLHFRFAGTPYEAIDECARWCDLNGKGRYVFDHVFDDLNPRESLSVVYFDDQDTAFWFKVRFG